MTPDRTPAASTAALPCREIVVISTCRGTFLTLSAPACGRTAQPFTACCAARSTSLSAGPTVECGFSARLRAAETLRASNHAVNGIRDRVCAVLPLSEIAAARKWLISRSAWQKRLVDTGDGKLLVLRHLTPKPVTNAVNGCPSC